MTNKSEIREHMEVTGSDGKHVGTVDSVEGDSIKLTASDPTSGGRHHFIPADMVASVRDGAVYLNLSAEEARRQWQEGAPATR